MNDLFAQALSGDYDDETAWEAVRSLRRLGTREVLERGTELCKSNDPLYRARGASVLAQLGKTADHPSNNFPDESYAVVTDLVRQETHPQPLAAGIAALGHLGNSAAVPLIAGFQSHPDPNVRFDVAFALGCFPDDPLGSETLLRLTQDSDEDVRDWATFGLGTLSDADSNEIREALVRRLLDTNEDAREEAMVGLGKRKDPRVLPTLLAALEDPTTLVIEAAYLMLGMEKEQQDWDPDDYATALRQRFPVEVPDEPERRRASRLIVLDPEGRILLFRYRRKNGEMFWAPPGGGLEEGETFEQAALREAFEELGTRPSGVVFLWEGVTDFIYIDRPVRQHERFFRVEGDLSGLLSNVEQAHREEGILESKWWTLPELDSTREIVFPEGLTTELRQRLTAG
jgi:HEAT repeat protein/8-oxo-dGTP pyrophosphatase MutT (NUDIX family)